MSLASTLTNYTEQIVPLGVLFQDAVGGPPTIEGTAGYNANLDSFEFVADVDQLTVPLYPDGGLPQLTIVETSSMRIVYKAAYLDEAELLAAANGV